MYRALYQTRDEESEEEGPTQQDVQLVEHIKLQTEIAKKAQESNTITMLINLSTIRLIIVYYRRIRTRQHESTIMLVGK